MRRLTGYDPETGHAEPGWAVEMGFEAACDLGLRFKQDAIFWVSENRVWVAKCGPDRQRKEIGPFDDRFQMKEGKESGPSQCPIAYKPAYTPGKGNRAQPRESL